MDLSTDFGLLLSRCWIDTILVLYVKYPSVYKQILSTLFEGNSDQACKNILELHTKNGFCVVDYLYFANVAGKQMFSQHHALYPIDAFREALLADYKTMNIHGVYAIYQKAILEADVVLMDGIALQMFYFLAKKKWLDNLNGTDFCPYFLSYVKQNYPHKNMDIILYGTYPHLLEKTKDFLVNQWYTVVYAQDGYTNLNWAAIWKVLWKEDGSINVLLVARSTPDYPIQEIRTLANKDAIRHHKLIVLNQAGTFDFWVGEQKRAPKLIRSLKLERLRRLISDPKRNIKKVVSTLAIFKYIFSYLILKKE